MLRLMPQPWRKFERVPSVLPPPVSGEERVERAWAHWRWLASPRLVVAPMADNSELLFCMLCRLYGADAAYAPSRPCSTPASSPRTRGTGPWSSPITTCKVIDSLTQIQLASRRHHYWIRV
uniref:DUS-like FMN-binding domain-containing protein n=1 Tax=Arundo donax TaxID=35708 RepID=A0A0A9GCV1_ARUDO